MSKKYNTLFLFLGAFMGAYGFLMTGFNVATGEGVKLLGDLVMAAVGLILVLMIVSDRIREVHNHNGVVEKLAEKLGEELASIDPKAKRDVDDLVKAMLDASPDSPPETDEQLRVIEKKYLESTGRSVNLAFRRDDEGHILGLDSEFSDPENAPEAAVKPEPVKVRVDAPSAVKRLTKSQQRRINEKKGRGPFTDDELKQQANEKRRAARIAKKAAESPASEQPTLKEKVGA